MKNKKFILISLVFFAVQVKYVFAIPSTTIIPFIGPIIGYISLLIISGSMFILSNIKKYRIIFMTLGIVSLLFAILARVLGLF